jgi:excisionase family DNA binding protein
VSELTYTVEEAAAAIGIGKNQMYALVRTDRVPHIDFGRTKRIPKAAFSEWLIERANEHASMEVDG